MMSVCDMTVSVHQLRIKASANMHKFVACVLHAIHLLSNIENDTCIAHELKPAQLAVHLQSKSTKQLME